MNAILRQHKKPLSSGHGTTSFFLRALIFLKGYLLRTINEKAENKLTDIPPSPAGFVRPLGLLTLHPSFTPCPSFHCCVDLTAGSQSEPNEALVALA